MTEELTLRGFIARLQAKSTDAELSYAECKYAEAVERVAKKKRRKEQNELL